MTVKILLLAAVIYCVSSEYWFQNNEFEENEIQSKKTKREVPIRACGEDLYEVMKFYCNGNYEEKFPVIKKNSLKSGETHLTTSDLFKLILSTSIFDKEVELNRLGRKKRYRLQKRGLATDCCVRGCYISEIMAYCKKSY
ncbi:hypothetical protein O3M35_009734 [Rhynocoris fuscipes]|uniref:Insulin-like domain-containing protein n=1 Tax=Rhynocoris fuscipes TaxID=488301 RepID=A0AAW1D7M2_9HEMI